MKSHDERMDMHIPLYQKKFFLKINNVIYIKKNYLLFIIFNT
jgi:hypothetical protein